MYTIYVRDRVAGVHATRNTYIFREKKKKRETFLANREREREKEISRVSINQFQLNIS
jgi:hypothetical protein